MKPLIQLLALVCLAAIAIPSFMLWSATGRHAFTTLPSEAMGSMLKQEGSLTGLFDDAPTQPPMDNAFALGLVPGGLGASSASILTFVGPGMFLAMAAFFLRGRQGRGT